MAAGADSWRKRRPPCCREPEASISGQTRQSRTPNPRREALLVYCNRLTG